MRIKSVGLAVAVATGLLTMGQMVASANVVWCIADPPMQVTTPAGSNLSVNTTVYLPKGQQHLMASVVETSSTASDGAGGTLVTVNVQIPAGVATARIVSSVNRFKVSAEAYGTGGSTVTLYLDVPAA